MSSSNAQFRPRRSDGERTHGAILEAAMGMASLEGLGTVTIGRLAKKLGVSKSGLYAHFGSKRRLQLETLEAARGVFAREVIEPGLAAPKGVAQLESLCEAFVSYVERGVFPGGCFFAGLLSEFDGQTGEVHEQTAADHRQWLGLLEQLARDARERGELNRETDLDQLAFELDAAVELANYLFVLYRDPNVLQQGRAAVRNAIARRRADG
jgi:AcrR family transcriptional regulator